MNNRNKNFFLIKTVFPNSKSSISGSNKSSDKINTTENNIKTFDNIETTKTIYLNSKPTKDLETKSKFSNSKSSISGSNKSSQKRNRIKDWNNISIDSLSGKTYESICLPDPYGESDNRLGMTQSNYGQNLSNARPYVTCSSITLEELCEKIYKYSDHKMISDELLKLNRSDKVKIKCFSINLSNYATPITVRLAAKIYKRGSIHSMYSIDLLSEFDKEVKFLENEPEVLSAVKKEIKRLLGSNPPNNYSYIAANGKILPIAEVKPLGKRKF